MVAQRPEHVPAALLAYMDMWNEADSDKIPTRVEAVFVPDARFTDPMHDVVGHEAITTMVLDLRTGFPEAHYSLASTVDGHHDRYRYHWHADLGDAGELPGFDVTLLAPDGRIARVDGFFGPLA